MSLASYVSLLRPNKIIVEAYDRFGNRVTRQYEGYVARIFQHEIDHLHGKRFPDRIEDFANLHLVTEEEFPIYKQEFKNWPNKVSKEQWETYIGL